MTNTTTALDEKTGRFQLGGVRYTFHAMLLPADDERPERWQINVHELGLGVMPAAFKVAPTFQEAFLAAKDVLR